MRNVYVSSLRATGGALRYNVTTAIGAAGVRNLVEADFPGKVLVELDLSLGFDALVGMLTAVHDWYDTQLLNLNVLFYKNEHYFVQQENATFLLGLSQSDIDKLCATNPHHIAAVRVDVNTELGRAILEVVHAKITGLLTV